MELVDHWKASIRAFSAVVEQIGEDQWSAPTPCPDWTVHQLVSHVADWQRTTVGQLDAPAAISTSLEHDPAAGWAAVRGALEAAVDADGALDQIMDSAFGAAPFGEMMLLPAVDLMFHTWDLATAIGADATLPESTCVACYETMLPFDDAIRQSTGAYSAGYADKIEPPPDADAQTLLLCFGGRQP
jgi:uncharacterized protein (TIGR03086 family)